MLEPVGQLDGPGLAADRGADHQLPGQGERHRHAGRALRQHCASDAGLAQTLAATFSTCLGAAFLTVTLLFIPCMATVAVIRQETGSWRWALADMGMFLAISMAAGIAVFNLLRLLGY